MSGALDRRIKLYAQKTHPGPEKVTGTHAAYITTHAASLHPEKARDLERYCFMTITNIIGKQTGSIDFFGGSAVVEHK